jgi:hypothetical protein
MHAVIDEIATERRRQIEVEGWTAEHDDGHQSGAMALAAGCYALNAGDKASFVGVPLRWPWANRWWKPENPRRDLIRAAALIVAEIERLDRAGAAGDRRGADHG